MLHELMANGIADGLEREYKFHPVRKWRIDFAWPLLKIGIEVHGALWKGGHGSHTSGAGRMRDMEKMNEAKVAGWLVIEVCKEQIQSGQAVDWIKQLFEMRASND